LRLDLFLKCVCLAKSRSLAAKGIEEGRVLLNGARTKASREVKPGDVLEISSRTTIRKVKVLEVPKGQVAKDASRGFYEILDETRAVDGLW
jgi:ribosomal 50S subunit-recycling heat shock protein